ncbi:MAG: adenylate/guanylate cyclase domain-containing protein [Mycobacterium sp.]
MASNDSPPRTRIFGRRRRGRWIPPLARVSILSKLIAMLVLCTITAGITVAGMARHAGQAELKASVFNRLTEIREAQKRALTEQMADLENSLTVYTKGTTLPAALAAFTEGFDKLADAPISPAQSQAITDYYVNRFVPETEKRSGVRLNAAALLPTSNPQRYLQANYTVVRRNDSDAVKLADAGDRSSWSEANAKFQEFFRAIVTRFQFEDALLLDGRGNVVYSAYKNVDLGTNILEGPYNGSNLRGAYAKALSSNAVDYVGLTDFEFYQPSELQPTAWMVAPVAVGDKTAGVLALQYPSVKINKLMTMNRAWVQSGMGQTGETLLVGPDGLFRSDGRLFVENPEQYKKEVVAAGTPSDVADAAIRRGGITLIQPAVAQIARLGQSGQSGTTTTHDYLGHEVLLAYTEFTEKDLHWTLTAKINTSEAFARSTHFSRLLVATTTGIIFVVVLLALFLAQLFVRPIRRLEDGARRIAAGEVDVSIPVVGRDELGDLTQAFNEMGRTLTVKEALLTEQRKSNEHLLLSLMPEAVADRYRQGEEITATEHQNVTVIFADVIGLDRLQSDLPPNESLALINDLIGRIDHAASGLGIERFNMPLRNGYLASCGLAVPRLDSVRRVIDFAVECERIVHQFAGEVKADLSLRAGIDTGSVISGLVGPSAMVYDMWGGAVSLAQQIKSGSPQPGIYVTTPVRNYSQDAMEFTAAGSITVDGEDRPIWRFTGIRR